MGEALTDKMDQKQELLSTLSKLRDDWLNSNNQYDSKITSLTISNEGVPRLRGYVREKRPDIESLEYNAIVGIAFLESKIHSEIHYTFPVSEKITSFTAVDFETDLIYGYDLINETYIDRSMYDQRLDQSEQLTRLSELIDYFERLTSFSIPYEQQYAKDVAWARISKKGFWKLMKIEPYLFMTDALK